MNEPAMHAAHPREAIKACAWCHGPFTPRRGWQLYCGRVCRVLSNERKQADGMRASVSKVSVLKSGALSVVLRFSPIEKERALKSLEPGKLVGVMTDG